MPGMEPFFIGTNSVGASQGLYSMGIDSETGAIGIISTVPVYNSGVLLWQRGEPVLYALSEGMTFLGKAEGGVLSFSLVGGAPVAHSCAGTGGQRPCTMALSRIRKELYVGNFLGGTISVMQLDEEGKIGALKRQFSVRTVSGAMPGVHDIINSPRDDYLLVLEVQEHGIHVYKKDEIGDAAVYSHHMKPDTFPRKMVFGKDGRTLYVASQRRSEVLVFRWQPEIFPMLEHLQTISTLPGDYQGGNAPSSIKVSPDGRLLAVVNRIFDHVTLYRVNGDGLLEEPAYSPIVDRLARDCGFSADGRYLIVAGTASDTVSSYLVGETLPNLMRTDTCWVPSPAAVAAGNGGERWIVC